MRFLPDRIEKVTRFKFSGKNIDFDILINCFRCYSRRRCGATISIVVGNIGDMDIVDVSS
jgi:hypothetical protein